MLEGNVDLIFRGHETAVKEDEELTDFSPLASLWDVQVPLVFHSNQLGRHESVVALGEREDVVGDVQISLVDLLPEHPRQRPARSVKVTVVDERLPQELARTPPQISNPTVFGPDRLCFDIWPVNIVSCRKGVK